MNEATGMNKVVKAGWLAAVAACLSSVAEAAPLPTLDDCNVVWDSPSKDASGTMPLGNGDISANVWVQDGDLLFLIGKTDAWDENSINCKLARVRVKLSPNPFAAGNPFRQELRLRQGEIVIQAGKPGAEVTTRLWVDANQPVIRVETTSDQPVSQQVLLETWRNEERVLTNTQVSDMFKNLYGPDPYPTLLFPDVVVSAKDQLLWYHHNHQLTNDPYVINLTLHGGNLQLALQLMLLQSEPGPTGKLRLLPTWPKDWDVSFKLHAPNDTTVECVYRDGKIEALTVTPVSRHKDVIKPR